MSHPRILGDVGTVYRATVKDQDNVVVDVSGASTKEIIFRSPTGVLKPFDAAFTTDGIDGQIEYKTLTGNINEEGTWEWQPHVIITAGNEWYGDPKEFVVKDKLKAA